MASTVLIFVKVLWSPLGFVAPFFRGPLCMRSLCPQQAAPLVVVPHPAERLSTSFLQGRDPS